VAYDTRVNELNQLIDAALALKPKSAGVLKEWQQTYKEPQANKLVSIKLGSALADEIKSSTGALNNETISKGKLKGEIKSSAGELATILQKIYARRDLFIKKSVWCLGGDGWAYDIGYGGLDHVLARGEDINILVLDTEVYSNTGGQASKATPTGSVAKFANAGKKTAKKSLALMAMNYPNVYVAQIAMGANMNQTLQALREAEAHKGPSIVIAYATCIEHGIDMSKGNEEMKKAVACGYWNLFRYNPELVKNGKPALILDSPVISGDYKEFVKAERRYANLFKTNPTEAEALLEQAKLDSESLLAKLKKLSQ